MTIIMVMLTVIAAYCFGMWLRLAYHGMTQNLLTTELESIEQQTFHLGLCGVLALGFVGLMLK